MTEMMENFLSLLHHTHHHPACGGDVLAPCMKNQKQHAFYKWNSTHTQFIHHQANITFIIIILYTWPIRFFKGIVVSLSMGEADVITSDLVQFYM